MSENLNQHYIDACREASQRSRYILILLTIASLIGLLASYNTWEHSWIKSRYHRTLIAQQILHDSTLGNQPMIDKVSWYLDQVQDRKLTMAERTLHKKIINEDNSCLFKQKFNWSLLFDTTVVSPVKWPEWVSYYEVHQIKAAFNYLSKKRLNGDQIEVHLQTVNELYNDILQVGIPILGLNIDVNDLSTVGGIGLIGLLLLLCFCLYRELSNLLLLKNQLAGKPMTTRYSYFYILAMYQVINIPSIPASFKRVHRIMSICLNVATFLVFFLPAIIQGCIYAHDWMSCLHGLETDYYATKRTMLFGGVTTTLVALLALGAYYIKLRIQVELNGLYKNDEEHVKNMADLK